MYAKNVILLAVASLAADAVAVNVHRHGHEHMHEKKDLKLETDFTTVTEWVTVTYDPASSTSTAKFVAASHSKSISRTRKFSKQSSTTSSTSTTSSSTSSSSSSTETPTTLSTSVKPTEEEKAPTVAPVVVPTTTEAPAPAPPVPTTSEAPQPTTTAAATSAAPTTVSTGGKKRGLAYNDPNLLSPFVGENSKVSWAYNWGQTNDLNVAAEFIPMLWGPGDDHVSTWDENANKAIAAGSSALLSFNEPDNAGQSNLDPATAASLHQKYLNPYAGKARISTPAITNSNADGQGISWLTQFLSACAGNCALDFAAVHWYNNGDDFLSHLEAVYEAVKLPIWVTEFSPVGSDLDYNQFLATVVNELDTNPKYSFVERYSYFMVSEGRLVTGGQPNTLGNTFAYAS